MFAAATMVKADLSDEFHLIINPVVIRNGMIILKAASQKAKLNRKVTNRNDTSTNKQNNDIEMNKSMNKNPCSTPRLHKKFIHYSSTWYCVMLRHVMRHGVQLYDDLW